MPCLVCADEIEKSADDWTPSWDSNYAQACAGITQPRTRDPNCPGRATGQGCLEKVASSQCEPIITHHLQDANAAGAIVNKRVLGEKFGGSINLQDQGLKARKEPSESPSLQEGLT